MPPSDRAPRPRPPYAAGAVVLAAVALAAVVATCSDRPGSETTAPDAPAARAIATGADPVLLGAGDIAVCGRSGDETTSALLDGISGTVATLGDNAYEDGTATEFANCYEPSWGRHKARTRPTPGNHEYHGSDASGYYGYFGSAAGPSGRGYYSYDLGSWHVISLNSNVAADNASAQLQWLRQDLAANPRACTVAYWHHPVFSSGDHGNSSKMATAWRVLDSAEVDVVLAAHDHDYERFAPQTSTGVADARGIRQFVVGTGGASLRSFGKVRANSEVRNSNTLGVLKLTLHADSYSWEFVAQPGASFRDSGSASCVTGDAPPTPPPPPPGDNDAPVARLGGPYTVDEGTALTLSAVQSSDPDGDPLTYAWTFGDGTTGSGAAATKTFADDGRYTVRVVVGDPRGAKDTASTTVRVRNVRPRASLVAPASASAGATYTLAITNVTDPSSADLAAGFTYKFDCGAGFTKWGRPSSVTCPGVRDTGPRTVIGRVRDKEHGVRSYTATVRIE